MPQIRNQVNVTVTAADTQLLPGNLRRQALLISSPHFNTVWLSFVGPAAVGVGLAMRPNTNLLLLTTGHVGEALVEEIRAVSEGAPENIGVIEVFG